MLKDIDQLNPKTGSDKKWREDLTFAPTFKPNEWYSYRLVGGVFSYSTHWIEFTSSKDGKIKKFPIECANWDRERESMDKTKDCYACELNLPYSTKYLVNAIDRSAQQRLRAGLSPIVVLDLTAKTLRNIIALGKANARNGVAVPVTHPQFGRDLLFQYNTQGKNAEWMVQMGDCVPLTDEETACDYFDISEAYKIPDRQSVMKSLSRVATGNKEEADAATLNMPLAGSLIPEETEIRTSSVVSTQVVQMPVAAEKPSIPHRISVNPTTQQQAVTQAVTTTPTEVATQASSALPTCFADGVNGNRHKGNISCVRCKVKDACLANTNNA